MPSNTVDRRARDDAELLRLGRLFEPLHAKFWAGIERIEASKPGEDLGAVDTETEQAIEDLQPILRAIVALRPHTEAGERVKVLAWAHCENCEEEAFEKAFHGCPSDALRASVLRDALERHGITLRPKPAPRKRFRDQERSRGSSNGRWVSGARASR